MSRYDVGNTRLHIQVIFGIDQGAVYVSDVTDLQKLSVSVEQNEKEHEQRHANGRAAHESLHASVSSQRQL